jgi:hypothetical protein
MHITVFTFEEESRRCYVVFIAWPLRILITLVSGTIAVDFFIATIG